MDTSNKGSRLSLKDSLRQLAAEAQILGNSSHNANPGHQDAAGQQGKLGSAASRSKVGLEMLPFDTALQMIHNTRTQDGTNGGTNSAATDHPIAINGVRSDAQSSNHDEDRTNTGKRKRQTEISSERITLTTYRPLIVVTLGISYVKVSKKGKTFDVAAVIRFVTGPSNDKVKVLLYKLGRFKGNSATCGAVAFAFKTLVGELKGQAKSTAIQAGQGKDGASACLSNLSNSTILIFTQSVDKVMQFYHCSDPISRPKDTLIHANDWDNSLKSLLAAVQAPIYICSMDTQSCYAHEHFFDHQVAQIFAALTSLDQPTLVGYFNQQYGSSDWIVDENPLTRHVLVAPCDATKKDFGFKYESCVKRIKAHLGIVVDDLLPQYQHGINQWKILVARMFGTVQDEKDLEDFYDKKDVRKKANTHNQQLGLVKLPFEDACSLMHDIRNGGGSDKAAFASDVHNNECESMRKRSSHKITPGSAIGVVSKPSKKPLITVTLGTSYLKNRKGPEIKSIGVAAVIRIITGVSNDRVKVIMFREGCSNFKTAIIQTLPQAIKLVTQEHESGGLSNSTVMVFTYFADYVIQSPPKSLAKKSFLSTIYVSEIKGKIYSNDRHEYWHIYQSRAHEHFFDHQAAQIFAATPTVSKHMACNFNRQYSSSDWIIDKIPLKDPLIASTNNIEKGHIWRYEACVKQIQRSLGIQMDDFVPRKGAGNKLWNLLIARIFRRPSDARTLALQVDNGKKDHTKDKVTSAGKEGELIAATVVNINEENRNAKSAPIPVRQEQGDVISYNPDSSPPPKNRPSSSLHFNNEETQNEAESFKHRDTACNILVKKKAEEQNAIEEGELREPLTQDINDITANVDANKGGTETVIAGAATAGRLDPVPKMYLEDDRSISSFDGNIYV